MPTVSDAADVTSHSVDLSGLTPATTYRARVRSADPSANEVESAFFEFTTTDASRLSWIPTDGTTILGFTVGGGRDYDDEVAKVRLANADWSPGAARLFCDLDDTAATFTNFFDSIGGTYGGMPVYNFTRRLVDDTSWMYEDVIAGVYDADIDAAAVAIKAKADLYGVHYACLLVHEPHANVETNAPVGATYEEACTLYREAVAYFVTRWKLTDNTWFNCFYQSTEFQLNAGNGDDCYAGDAYIDAVGYTGANGDLDGITWKTPAERWAMADDWCVASGKPVFVLAGGCAEDPADTPARKVAWLDGIAPLMASAGHVLYIYPSTTFADTGSVQWIDTTPESLAAFQALSADAQMQGA